MVLSTLPPDPLAAALRHIMFLRSLRDTLILLVASTAAVLAAPSLSVKVTG